MCAAGAATLAATDGATDAAMTEALLTLTRRAYGFVSLLEATTLGPELMLPPTTATGEAMTEPAAAWLDLGAEVFSKCLRTPLVSALARARARRRVTKSAVATKPSTTAPTPAMATITSSDCVHSDAACPNDIWGSQYT